MPIAEQTAAPSSTALDLAWVRAQFPSLAQTVNGNPAVFLDGPRRNPGQAQAHGRGRLRGEDAGAAQAQADRGGVNGDGKPDLRATLDGERPQQ